MTDSVNNLTNLPIQVRWSQLSSAKQLRETAMRFYQISCLALIALSQSAMAQTSREAAVAVDGIEASAPAPFALETIGPALEFPWSLALLPAGGFLVTEKHRGLRLINRDGTAPTIVSGLPPEVLTKEDGGYLDIALDPGFASNGLIYLAFVEGTEAANRTAIWKARLTGDRLVDGKVIFRSNVAKKGPSHPGGRMLFLPDGTLLLTVGDGYDYRDAAQDPASHLGKILRLNADGSVPRDNPFVGQAGHAPEIWTLGHRNVQGLTRDPATGAIWSHEHGPRGGDEINLLKPGQNYGWPRALWGIDYDGKPISDRSRIDGLSDPQFFWAPSIAPSGLATYHGSAFPEWEGKFLVGALAARSLVLLRQGKETGLLIEEARLLSELKWRIRDVRVSSTGAVYLLTDEQQGRLLQLVPVTAKASSSTHDHPLTFLVGNWRGESRLSPLAKGERKSIAETSSFNCRFILGEKHVRCTARFKSNDGRTRTVEQSYSAGALGKQIHGSVLSDRWAGHSALEFTRDPASGAFIAELPFEHEGRRFVERITMQPSGDGRVLTHVEESRPAASGDWTETFRWVLKRED